MEEHTSGNSVVWRNNRDMWRNVYIANFDSIFCCLPAPSSQKIWVETHCLLNDGIEMWEVCQSLIVCNAHIAQFLANLADMLRMHRELVEYCCQYLCSRLTVDYQPNV